MVIFNFIKSKISKILSKFILTTQLPNRTLHTQTFQFRKSSYRNHGGDFSFRYSPLNYNNILSYNHSDAFNFEELLQSSPQIDPSAILPPALDLQIKNEGIKTVVEQELEHMKMQRDEFARRNSVLSIENMDLKKRIGDINEAMDKLQVEKEKERIGKEERGREIIELRKRVIGERSGIGDLNAYTE